MLVCRHVHHIHLRPPQDTPEGVQLFLDDAQSLHSPLHFVLTPRTSEAHWGKLFSPFMEVYVTAFEEVFRAIGFASLPISPFVAIEW